MNAGITVMTSAATLGKALSAMVRAMPAAVAILHEGRAYSYSEFEHWVRRIAAGFVGCGIGRGDRVALWLPSVPAWIASMFALARLGAIAVATNTRFRAVELVDIFNRAGVGTVVYGPNYRGTDYSEILDQIRGDVPTLHTVIAFDEAGDTQVKEVPGLRTLSFSALDTGPEHDDDQGSPKEPCVIFTTSGTTRRPKLVMHCQAAVVEHALDAGRSLQFDEAGACVFNALPLSGTFGFTQAMMCLFNGAPMVLQTTFDEHAAAQLLRRHHVMLSGMTDEMIRRIYAADEEPIPFLGLHVFTGSRADKLVDMAAARGFIMIGLYGSSECHAMFAHGRVGDEPATRAAGGGFPVSPKAEIRATDLDTGAVLAHGQPGQLEFRSPTLTLGYYGDAEATTQAFSADGFFRTGDLGTTEQDGSFRYLSRLNDSLRLKGFLVSPVEIEAFISEFRGVRLCQVVGADGADGLPRAVAFYTTLDGSILPEDDLRSHCAAGLAAYKVPACFVHLDEYPVIRSPNAVKVNRVELRRIAADLLAAPVAGSTPDASLSPP